VVASSNLVLEATKSESLELSCFIGVRLVLKKNVTRKVGFIRVTKKMDIDSVSASGLSLKFNSKKIYQTVIKIATRKGYDKIQKCS
jgi:hypothetical protein